MQVALIPSGVLGARILGPRDLGYLALFQLFPVIIWQVGGLGLPTALTYFIAKNPSTSGTVVRNLRGFILLQVCLLLAVHSCVVTFILSSRPESVRSAGLISLLVVPAGLAYQYGLAILQGQQRFHTFNVLRAAVPLVYSLGVIFAFIGQFGSLRIIMSFYVGTLSLIGVISLTKALAQLPPPQPETERGSSAVVKFGVKSLVSTISPIETFRIDQAIVGLLISPFGLGLYVVGLSFTTFPKMIAQSIGFIAYPRVAAASPQQATKLIWRYFLLSIVICLAVVGILVLLVPTLIPMFFGPGFEMSIGLAKILLLATLFAGARRTLAESVKGAGDPLAGTIAEIASWFVLVAAVLAFGQQNVANVAYALLLSSVLGLSSLLLVVYLRRNFVSRTELPIAHAPSDALIPVVSTVQAKRAGSKRSRPGEPDDL